jgi:hypothetical protein
MQFVLTGFTQDLGSRVFAFEGVAPDKIRTAFTVRADLAAARRYGIQMQDLPLLCRALLERSEDGNQTKALIFCEEQMRRWSSDRATAREVAALKRKPPRRPGHGLVAAAVAAPTLGT